MDLYYISVIIYIYPITTLGESNWCKPSGYQISTYIILNICNLINSYNNICVSNITYEYVSCKFHTVS